MFESESEIRELQALIDRTLAHANPHLARGSSARNGAYGSSPFEWGEGVVFMRIEPTPMWAYAFHPENVPE